MKSPKARLQRWWRARRLRLEDLVVDVDPKLVAKAKEAAAGHGPAIYPQLRYTEREYLWVLLYEHLQRGQLHPETIKRMRTVDLEYVAGHPLPHPDLIPVQPGDTPAKTSERRGRAMKLVENVARATRELEHRSSQRAYLVAGGIGAAVGGVAAALVTAWLR